MQTRKYTATFTLKNERLEELALERIVYILKQSGTDFSIVQDYTQNGRVHWHCLITTNATDKWIMDRCRNFYRANFSWGAPMLGYVHVTDVTVNPHKWRMYMRKRNQNKKCKVYTKSHDTKEIIKDVSQAPRPIHVPEGRQEAALLPSEDEGNDEQEDLQL